MAEIRKVTRGPVVSNFQQVAPEAGGTFRVLADMADMAYERLKPEAMRLMAEKGAERGRDLAKSQIGNPQFSSGGKSYREAIKAIESSGNYSALGPVTKSGDRAYGAYQVMGANIGPWTEKHVGRRMTPQEFLADKAAQDAVFDAEFGSYVSRYGNPQDAASMWFSGRPLSQAGNSSDGMTTVPEYVRRFSEQIANIPAATVVRTSDGKLEPRLFSPMSGDILAAHDAAEGVAYASEAMNAGATEMMSLSEQFALDPNGFQQAAQGYVDKMVEKAPDRFRADVRASLEKEMQRRFLGVMEEKQTDIRRRADNSSAALVDRWSANLAEAIASGNRDEIDSAQTELASILRARESLPGVSWTPEQSANVFLEADRQAERIRAAALAKSDAAIKDTLKTITAAASAGLHAADESILSDTHAAEIAPDEWEKAVGAAFIRDWMPSFKSSTPSEQAAAVAQMKSEPITSQAQITAVKAAETAASNSAKAWREDPIAQAAAVLDLKPPPLPAFDAASPEAFISALSARAAYGRKLSADGYIKTPAFLSSDEAETVGALLGKGVDPAIKAVLSGAIASAFGEDAAAVFNEMKSDDPVTLYAGLMIAGGGSQAAATAAMRGQQLLDEGVVKAPSSAASLPSEVTAALSVVPSDAKKMGDLIKFATAIYANTAQGVDPSSEQAASLYKSAMQIALGQDKDRRGRVTGGVQPLGGYQTLLPIGVSSEDVDAGIRAALGKPAEYWPLLNGGKPRSEAVPPNVAIWGGKTPMLGGEPITQAMWDKGLLRIVPAGKSGYRIEMMIQGQVASDVRDENGAVFFFDLTKLAEMAAQ